LAVDLLIPIVTMTTVWLHTAEYVIYIEGVNSFEVYSALL